MLICNIKRVNKMCTIETWVGYKMLYCNRFGRSMIVTTI